MEEKKKRKDIHCKMCKHVLSYKGNTILNLQLSKKLRNTFVLISVVTISHFFGGKNMKKIFPFYQRLLVNTFVSLQHQYLDRDTSIRLSASLKVHYRHKLLRNVLMAMESGNQLKIAVLDAMQWLKIAWDKVTPSTTESCFHHCSFTRATHY